MVMDDKQPWETPQFEALTDSEIRADQADITVRNGILLQLPPGSVLP
jgi:hypothetical protein